MTAPNPCLVMTRDQLNAMAYIHAAALHGDLKDGKIAAIGIDQIRRRLRMQARRTLPLRLTAADQQTLELLTCRAVLDMPTTANLAVMTPGMTFYGDF